jgi:hypothetical protein
MRHMSTFNNILKVCKAINQNLPDVVFIGGVAVYLQLSHKSLPSVPLESSHDADFMVSLSDYGILKDEEELTATPRLAKHQMFVGGVEFDVYVERLNRLLVPYDEIFAHSTTIEHIRVASLEHLLVLKLEALGQRGHSSKGEKDRRDLVKIGLLLGHRAKQKLLAPYLRTDHLQLLQDIAKSPIFFALCNRNAQDAKKVRIIFDAFMATLT